MALLATTYLPRYMYVTHNKPEIKAKVWWTSSCHKICQVDLRYDRDRASTCCVRILVL